MCWSIWKLQCLLSTFSPQNCFRVYLLAYNSIQQECPNDIQQGWNKKQVRVNELTHNVFKLIWVAYSIILNNTVELMLFHSFAVPPLNSWLRLVVLILVWCSCILQIQITALPLLWFIMGENPKCFLHIWSVWHNMQMSSILYQWTE